MLEPNHGLCVTRRRTRPLHEGNVVHCYVSGLPPNCGLQDHLVGALQGHVTLTQKPLVLLGSRLLPNLQEDGFTMRM